jgi:hypothetical protein
MTFFVLIPLGLFALLGLVLGLLPFALLLLAGFFVVWVVLQSAGPLAAIALLLATGAVLGSYEAWERWRWHTSPASLPYQCFSADPQLRRRRRMEPRPWVKALIGERDDLGR